MSPHYYNDGTRWNEPETKEVTITFEVPEDSHIDELAITTLLKGMGAGDICIDINEL